MRALTSFLILLLTAVTLLSSPAPAQERGQVPGDALGGTSDADFWRAVREGERFSTSLQDAKAATLIQSEGENWRAIRNGPLSRYGAWLLLGMVGLLALFFMIRGRIRIEGGRTGHVVTRFDDVERFIHWLTAISFVILALTGLNLLYGRYTLLPLIGGDAFALVTAGGKYLHNYVGFAFMLGVVLAVVRWIPQNLPNRHDLIWLMKGGGLLFKAHAPARKFNAAQKMIFWVVVLGGVSVSTSGVMLLFPFQFDAFGPTFAVVNGILGTGFPEALDPTQEQQFALVWHAIVGLVLSAVVIGHIYIGTIGMEGAFDAMGSGKVDENWAREHHSLWYVDLERRGETTSGGDD